jgi:hypothetical protein
MNGKTRDRVAEAVGMSGRTYEKAKQVAEAAEKDPEPFGELREEMDATGKVDGPHKKRQERKQQDQQPQDGQEINVKGVGVFRANEAINSLTRIHLWLLPFGRYAPAIPLPRRRVASRPAHRPRRTPWDG